MKFCKVLIVEDEILIAETIKMYLQERGHHVTDIAISFDEAVSALEADVPDVVLLDVRLYGEKSGIDFANYLIARAERIPFIFLTSQFDKRIVENAMTTNPSGYLTKPMQKESLWTTTELAYNQALIAKESRKLVHINDGDKTHVVDINDILYINSDHVYINFHLKDEKPIIVRKSLGQALEELNENQFIQCHRGYIININYVTTYNMNHVIIDDVQIPLSRSRKREVLEKIKLAKK